MRLTLTPPQVSAAGPDPLADFRPDTQILVPRQGYLTAVRHALGGTIDMDLCSSHRRQSLVDAASFYPADQVEASLAEPWYGDVFLQPFPSNKLGRRQLRKLLIDYLSDRVTSALILVLSAELHRHEPLLFSFPFCIHYRRLSLLRWSDLNSCWTTNRSSTPATSFYLPAKAGIVVNEERLQQFTRSFRPMGRIIIGEEIEDYDWQRDCYVATAQARVKPLLTRREFRQP